MSARSRKLNESLGSSWGDADYASDEASSTHSANDFASEVEWEDSDREVAQQRQPDVVPFPTSRTKRTHLSQSTPPSQIRSKPSRQSASNRTTRQSHTLEPSKTRQRATKSLHRTTAEEPPEPSFIMPTMYDSPNRKMGGEQARASPQVRKRATNQPSLRNSITDSAAAGQSSFVDRQAHRAKNQHQEQEGEELGPWHYVNLVLQNLVFPLLAYILDIFTYAMRHFIKPILGVLLGIGIIVLGIQAGTSLLRSSLKHALLAPVCSLPGSNFFIPACRDDRPQANFEELVNVQNQFEDIVDASKDVHTLPSSIKDSELAIRDLRTLVKFSRLPSRNELDNEFENFILTAKEASQDLARYNSRIGAATDRIIATNKWTLNVLHGLEESSASTGALSTLVTALTSSFSSPTETLQSRIFDQYVLHVSRNKDEIDSLIQSATSLLWILTNLDDRLTTIYGIAVNDDTSISAKNEELLSSLWTKLGGNRADVKANAKSINLLRNIYAYRKKAVIHVSDTLVKLQTIQAELENLREGVSGPALSGGPNAGLPIDYHVEVIGRGVERLQASRGEQFRVEAKSYLDVVRGGSGGTVEGVREVDGPVVTAKTK
ncbi:hypothetical protein T440DRAFT_471458 [Plenodomus tracheiphilus IPT5]|uniref:Uncharacterized protein n=1 Tax=Plenodomus tracheiphilus IPT5 TaxID=1408161 RepID=A0A6A7AUH7_9PLEO|nr:hypothetical protein T440DRAFT_471458 [Plenodomus tracheiphilus IPT5]